ncbi:MAG: FAD-dependent oxidoreductase [Clostridia bacterium]|nr:FAD-dependent oxidoreductase [Clostridia bacterium]
MKTVNVDLRISEDEALLFNRALKKSGLKKDDVSDWRILKKAVDARNKRDIKFCYVVELYQGEKREKPEIVPVEGNRSVVIVGAGPAGLFSALYLARRGVKVTVIERGASVENRSVAVKKFFDGGELDENVNVQFGEGGAGTFSDGKLNTQVNGKEIRSVLEDFVLFGAPKDILYLNKPHIGSDNLPKVVKNIRSEIISFGGQFRFNERMTELIAGGGKVTGVKTDKGEYLADKVILAIGHSSRDTFSYLHAAGVAMESKEFAVGFRVEQRQELIDRDRYGDFSGNAKLGAADYKLVSHATDRAVFTFCMCPGGVVVPSASEREGLVVNGMSNYLRSGENANSAVVCQVKKEDFNGDVLGGVAFQKNMERLAFIAGGGDFRAPVQLAEDFVSDVPTIGLKGVLPTYSRGYEFFELKKLLPFRIIESLRAGLFDMNGKIRGFASDGAVLTGVESRTSSPVRITRKDNFESVSHKCLYPCGEGCGYAGGIMSACVDGIKVASAIIDDFSAK